MQTVDFLKHIESVLRQTALKVRVDHENLETVYFESTSEGRVLVHDRGHVHGYLSSDKDVTYRSWSDLGVEFIREHCGRYMLTLENLIGDDDDPCYWICCRGVSDLEVAELVNRVADCQDAIFQAAYRDEGNVKPTDNLDVAPE